MKITIKKLKSTSEFSSLEIGDCFLMFGVMYIKIPKYKDNRNWVNCMSIRTRSLYFTPNTTIVQPVEIEEIIARERGINV